MDSPSLAQTWGYEFISCIVCAVLYGIIFLLVGQYFISQSQNDPMYLRLTVLLLWTSATLQTVFFGHLMYESFVVNFGNVLALDTIYFSMTGTVMATFLSILFAQSFFVSRVWIITKHNLYYTLPIAVLILVGFGFGLVQIVAMARFKKLSLIASYTAVAAVQYAVIVTCDVLITAVLCYILYDSKSGIKRSNSVIDKLIVYAVNRGAITSVDAVITLTLFLAFPNNFYYVIPLGTGGHLNVISVISMLTHRQSLRTELNGTNTFNTYPLSNTSDQHNESLQFSSRMNHPNPGHLDANLKSVITWREDTESDGNTSRIKKSAV